MSSPKNYGLSDSLISKVTEICEMSSNRAREYLKASTSQARELQGKIYTPDATEADKRKYKNRSKYFSKALKRSRSIGEDEDMTAEKNYGLSDDLIESARAVLAKSKTILDEGRGYKAHELDAAGYKHVNHVNSGQTSTTLYRHPDGHEIYAERGNNSKKYSFYSGKPGASSQAYHANLKDAIKKNGHLVEETLDEGRGRPRKTPLAAGEEEGNEPDQNIIMQLRKVQSLRGAKPVSFRDGSKHTVHMADALKAIRMHGMMRTSIEKGNFENKISKSHADFKRHIGSTIKSGGSEEEKKSKVTLPAVDRLRAKGKLDEEQLDELKRDFKRYSNGSESARDLITRTKNDSTTTLRGYQDYYDKQKPRNKTGAADHHKLVDKELKRRTSSGYPNGKLTKSPVMNAEDTQIDEAKPDFHYQEWPGKKPKKAFNLSKYLENSDKRTKAREKLNDDAKNKKGFFKEDEQLEENTTAPSFRPNQRVKFKHPDGGWKEGRVEDHEVYGTVSGHGPTKHNPNDHSTKAWGHNVSYDMDGKGKRGRLFVPKVHIAYAMKEQIGEASLDDVWKKAGKNYRMRLKSTDKPKPFTVGQHNDAVEARRAKAKTKPS